MGETLDVLQALPELEKLGQAKLQSLCDEWLASPLAKEFAITELQVSEEGGRLSLSFTCQMTHQVSDGEDYYFPMDELLTFIAEHGILDPEIRDRAKARIRQARQSGGPDIFRRFTVNAGPKLPLFVTCVYAECREVLQTPFYGRSQL